MSDASVSTMEFNKQLMELLCKADDKDANNYCLISNELLDENFIKLCCNHKFNYDSIFNEIRNQKKYTLLETQKLSLNQIKCPYCRTVQIGLLPHRQGYMKISGVNWPPKYQHLPNNCIYKFASGKRKKLPCNKKCMQKYCTNHAKIMKNRKSKADKRAATKSGKYQIPATNMSNSIIDPLPLYTPVVSQHLFGDSSPVTLEKLSLPAPVPQIHPLVAGLDKSSIWKWPLNAPSLPGCAPSVCPLGGTAQCPWPPPGQNYYYHKLSQGPSSMAPPPPVPPQPQGCCYIFKKGNKKGQKCSCKKLYKTHGVPSVPGTFTPLFLAKLCKTHYKQRMRAITKKKAKKAATKLVNTLLHPPQINAAINIPIIKQEEYHWDTIHLSSWQPIMSDNVIV